MRVSACKDRKYNFGQLSISFTRLPSEILIRRVKISSSKSGHVIFCCRLKIPFILS